MAETSANSQIIVQTYATDIVTVSNNITEILSVVNSLVDIVGLHHNINIINDLYGSLTDLQFIYENSVSLLPIGNNMSMLKQLYDSLNTYKTIATNIVSLKDIGNKLDVLEGIHIALSDLTTLGKYIISVTASVNMIASSLEPSVSINANHWVFTLPRGETGLTPVPSFRFDVIAGTLNYNVKYTNFNIDKDTEFDAPVVTLQDAMEQAAIKYLYKIGAYEARKVTQEYLETYLEGIVQTDVYTYLSNQADSQIDLYTYNYLSAQTPALIRNYTTEFLTNIQNSLKSTIPGPRGATGSAGIDGYTPNFRMFLDTTGILRYDISYTLLSGNSLIATKDTFIYDLHGSVKSETVNYLSNNVATFKGSNGRGVTSLSREGDFVKIVYSDKETSQFPLKDGSGISYVERNASTGKFTIYYDKGTSDSFVIKDGVGISSIDRVNETLTIKLTDNTFNTFVVRDGKDGKDGIGISSLSREVSTGRISLKLSNGQTLDFTIKDGVSLTSITRLEETLTFTKSDGSVTSFNLTDGKDGKNGVGITSLVQVGEYITVNYSDNSKSQLLLRQGVDGKDGADGTEGNVGFTPTTIFRLAADNKLWADTTYKRVTSAGPSSSVLIADLQQVIKDAVKAELKAIVEAEMQTNPNLYKSTVKGDVGATPKISDIYLDSDYVLNVAFDGVVKKDTNKISLKPKNPKEIKDITITTDSIGYKTTLDVLIGREEEVGTLHNFVIPHGRSGKDGKGITSLTTTNSVAGKIVVIGWGDNDTRASFMLENGKDGADGSPGLNPTMSLSNNAGKVTYSVSYSSIPGTPISNQELFDVSNNVAVSVSDYVRKNQSLFKGADGKSISFMGVMTTADATDYAGAMYNNKYIYIKVLFNDGSKEVLTTPALTFNDLTIEQKDMLKGKPGIDGVSPIISQDKLQVLSYLEIAKDTTKLPALVKENLGRLVVFNGEAMFVDSLTLGSNVVYTWRKLAPVVEIN